MGRTVVGSDVLGVQPSGNQALLAAMRQLISETQRAYEAGVFGVPSFVLGDEVFFGNDRLDMVGWRLQKMPNN
jgi:2-hydroxychromene-2-carboxylate isomerase